jgi:hypothetical protein
MHDRQRCFIVPSLVGNERKYEMQQMKKQGNKIGVSDSSEIKSS